MRGLTRALLALGAGCLMLAVLIGAIGLCLGGQFGSFQPTPDGLRYMPAGQDANDWVLTGGEDRQEQTVPLPDGTFTGLELDGGLAEVTVRPGESWNLTTTHPELYEVSREDGRLVIDSREPGISGHTVRNARLTLEVPAGLELETLELSIGLGSLNVRDLATGSLDVDAGMSGVTLTGITVRDDAELECGMGELTVENLTAKTVTGECGLGTMTLTDVTADSVDLACDMGTLTAKNLTVAGDTALHCDSGETQVTGTLAGSLTADCGMGSLTVTTPEPERYGLDGSCGMGTLTVGERSISGTGNSLTIDSSAPLQYRLSVDMGELTVRFTE